jgi:iron complex outermembrane receptor protein
MCRLAASTIAVRGCFRSRLFCGAWAAAAAVCAAGGAAAQGLDEIVVTAERRELSLQDTPISVVAFSSETMELKGIETIEDIATFTPNLDIKGSRFSGNNDPTWQIRGLSGGGGTTGERAVGLYIDGVYVPRTTGPFLNVLDIERIEVLRGPQGTLFGRNSTGGAIRIFTKKPGPDREAYVKLGLGNFDRQDVQFMVNAPVSDTFRIRAQLASLEEDGYVRRGSQMLGGEEDTIGRLQFAFLPSDAVTVNVNLSRTKLDSDGGAQDLTLWDMRPDLNFQGNYADWLSDFLQAAGQPRLGVYNDPRVVLDDYTMPDWCFIDDADPDWDKACEQWNKLTFDQLDATVEWRINDRMTLTSITGLSRYDSSAVDDAQLLGFSWSPSDVNSDTKYQEVQLNTALADGRINLVSGLTYFNEQASSDAEASLSVVGTSSFFAQQPLGDAWAGLRSQNNILTDTDSTSWGLFLNAAVNVTDKFTITPGVRWAKDEKFVEQTAFASDNFVPFEGDRTVIHAGDDWNKVDWRLTFDYNITDHHMVYVTASKAYRAGAYSLPSAGPGQPAISPSVSGEDQSAALAITPPFIPPETVENKEIGFRTEWLDRRLRVNLTYYKMLYTDRQGPIHVTDLTTTAGFVIRLADTGDVDLWGLELDGQLAVTDNFSLDFTAGKADYKLHDVCANDGDFLFPGPAEDSYSVGGRWSKDLRSSGNLTFSLSYGYVGDQETHPGGTLAPCASPEASWFFDSRYTNEGYGLLNGRIRYASSSGRWSGSLFANNLTDKVYSNYASRAGGGWWDFTALSIPPLNPTTLAIAVPQRSVVQQVRGRPREVGVTFQYNFGSGASATARR